ncbi:hypothetical protein M432DRAFT_381824 [Thermoascus aurantiacus ATCC 26904]
MNMRVSLGRLSPPAEFPEGPALHRRQWKEALASSITPRTCDLRVAYLARADHRPPARDVAATSSRRAVMLSGGAGCCTCTRDGCLMDRGRDLIRHHLWARAAAVLPSSCWPGTTACSTWTGLTCPAYPRSACASRCLQCLGRPSRPSGCLPRFRQPPRAPDHLCLAGAKPTPPPGSELVMHGPLGSPPVKGPSAVNPGAQPEAPLELSRTAAAAAAAALVLHASPSPPVPPLIRNIYASRSVQSTSLWNLNPTYNSKQLPSILLASQLAVPEGLSGSCCRWRLRHPIRYQ